MKDPNEKLMIVLTRKEMESLSYGLADLLCWHRGFSAGREGLADGDNSPMGVDAVRKLNIKLKEAL